MRYSSRLLPVCGLTGSLLFLTFVIGQPVQTDTTPNVEVPPVTSLKATTVDPPAAGVPEPVAVVDVPTVDGPVSRTDQPESATYEGLLALEGPLLLGPDDALAPQGPVLVIPNEGYASESADPTFFSLDAMSDREASAANELISAEMELMQPDGEPGLATTAEAEKTTDDGPADSETPTVQQKKQPKRELSKTMTALRDRVRKTLAMYRRPVLNTRQNSATEIMFGCLPFGCSTYVMLGNKRLNGITCLCWNYSCAGYKPMTICEDHLAARIGYGNQEHPSQMLATLALARVKSDYPLRAGETVRTVADLIEYEKLSCRKGSDMSMKLIGLSHYVEEETWKNDLGEEWSVEEILREEIAQPVVTAPNGGMNRLFGVSYAIAKREQRGLPLTGQYARADKFIDDFHKFAIATQNTDGSWGPYYIAAKAATRSQPTQLKTTGRILEWYLLSLPDHELDDARIVRSVNLVNNILISRYRSGVAGLSTREIGSTMHALHALAMYDDRYFKPADPDPAETKKPAESTKKTPVPKRTTTPKRTTAARPMTPAKHPAKVTQTTPVKQTTTSKRTTAYKYSTTSKQKGTTRYSSASKRHSTSSRNAIESTRRSRRGRR